MNFSLSDSFFVLVIFQLLFISLFLFSHHKGRRVSNALLGVFFLTICLNLLDNFLLLKNFYFSYPSLGLWSVWMILLLGPLLYLYTQSVLFQDFSLSIRKWLHFIPFLTLFSVTELAYLFRSGESKISILQHVVARKIPDPVFWGSLIIFLQAFLYIVASFRIIRRFKKMVQDQFSDQQRKDISWLTSTIFCFMVCMIASALNGILGLTPFANYFYLIFIIIIALIFLFINRVLLKALQNPEIFALMKENQPSGDKNQARNPVSYQDLPEGNLILERLLQFMKLEKPYLEPELTLEQLAIKLSLRPKILSQVINELLNQNFFDFVNRYRIEEAKKLLTHPKDKKITILEVLYEVGFNSKSSFNTLFKKHTGLTPSEFKRKYSH
jgi:AraC-like DNA-binding protein